MIRSDVKPALMAAIEGEFSKSPKVRPHVCVCVCACVRTCTCVEGGVLMAAAEGDFSKPNSVCLSDCVRTSCVCLSDSVHVEGGIARVCDLG